MDVDQLAVLRELGDRGSITAVAEATHKSPSAISQQLKTLQRQVGVVLVERVGRGVRLTDAGRALAQSSVRIATAIAEAESTWQAFTGGATGVVRVAVFPTAGELFVPTLVTRMGKREGIRLEIDVRDVSQDEFAALVADYDIVVAHRSDEAAPPDRDALHATALLREPLDVAVPTGHPLAGRARVTVEDIVREPWISVPEDYPIDRVLQTMALQAGVRPTVVYRTVHLPLIENMVAEGHGIALVPRYTSLARASGRFGLVTLADVRAGRYVEALSRPDRAARRAVRIVLDELVDAAAAVTASPIVTER